MTQRFCVFVFGFALLTAACGTAQPVAGTALPPSVSAPTATGLPPQPAGIGPTELKYRLLTQYPNLFFCDPDYYPVARANELDLARQKFAAMQADVEEFGAILAHNGLNGLATFSDDQKLLIYRDHKKLAAIYLDSSGTGYRFQLQVADTSRQGQLVSGLIDAQGAISGQQSTATIATCPICLAAGTLIDTPRGPVAVSDLRPGWLVWTVDADGARVVAPILQVGKTVVPATHEVVHIRLNDGRELWASPGHPTADGRRLGDLKPGDALDDGIVILAERTAYQGLATYDLLPAGATGFYWADGILVGSTLVEAH